MDILETWVRHISGKHTCTSVVVERTLCKQLVDLKESQEPVPGGSQKDKELPFPAFLVAQVRDRPGVVSLPRREET